MQEEILLKEIKNRFEKKLALYAEELESTYQKKGLSAFLLKTIREFILREGKRIRPILFCLGYMGYNEKRSENVYSGALSLELLHDFMLIHDDIIDNSLYRRGRPSMHAMIDEFLAGQKNKKIDGSSFAIIIGDILYTMGLDIFLSMEAPPKRKELALKQLISSALHTGGGEFTELLLATREIEEVTKEDIFYVYDHKTANYTFVAPLVSAVILSGAGEKETGIFNEYGMNLGRAFQIKDDILGTFGEVAETGKPNLTDFKDAKKTILFWHSFNHSDRANKRMLKDLFSVEEPKEGELHKLRKIFLASKSLAYAKKEVRGLIKKAERSLERSKMENAYREALKLFSSEFLEI